jgi:hypothetical protein
MRGYGARICTIRERGCGSGVAASAGGLMRDRRHATLLLLGSRLDGLWLPQGSLVTPSGLVPARLERCVLCDGAGSVSDRFGRRSGCTGCGGAGVVARDPMDSRGARVGSVDAPPAPSQRTVACDACAGDGVVKGRRCERCDGVGRRPANLFELRIDVRLEGEASPLDASLDARAASGSYAELDRLLADLRIADMRAWRGLLEAVDAGEVAPLPEPLEPPLRFLTERMPEPVRVPAGVVANGRELEAWRRRVRGRQAASQALEARDREIRRALRREVPVQWLAREYGLSVAQVYRVARAVERGLVA